jgi:hypothetical protein
MTPLHFAVPVWGAGYVETFLAYSLPSQLSGGNIGALPRGEGHSYVVTTRRSDHARMQAHPAFRALHDRIDVQVEYVDEALAAPDAATAEGKYRIKSDAYRRALQRARERGWAVVALNADIVVADGFVKTVLAELCRGKRVIQVPGPRGLLERIGPALVAGHHGSDSVSISIAPAKLSKLWLQHIHPLLDMHFVDGPAGSAFHPSHLYWRVGGEGIVVRGFHLYPIVVVPGRAQARFGTTIDADLVGNMRLRRGEVFLATDSRQLFCCELSPASYTMEGICGRGEVDRYLEFFMAYPEGNLRNLEREILITGEAHLGPQWDMRRKESADFAARLVADYRRALVRRGIWALRRARAAMRSRFSSRAA